MTTASIDTNSITPSTSQYTYTIRPAAPSDLPHLPTIESSAGALFKSLPGLEYLAHDEPMSVETHRKFLDKWRSGPLSHYLGCPDGGTWIAVAVPTAGLVPDTLDPELASESGCLQGDRSRDGDSRTGPEQPVGFIVTEVLPVIHAGRSNGEGKMEGYFIHINELSIAVDHQRRGLARRLLHTVKEVAFSLNRKADASLQSEGVDTGEFLGGGRLPVLGLSLTTFRDVPFNRPFYERAGFRILDRKGDGSGDEGVEQVCGVEGLKIWREERERFEGEDGREIREGEEKSEPERVWRRCWMVCEV